MSDIRANTISDASGNGPINLKGQSAAKAWVNFNGVNVTAPNDMTGVIGSFNVAGVIDESVGVYGVNYTNSFSSGNYAVNTSSTAGGATHFSGGFYTASSTRINTVGGSGNNSDASIITTAVNGDLA